MGDLEYLLGYSWTGFFIILGHNPYIFPTTHREFKFDRDLTCLPEYEVGTHKRSQVYEFVPVLCAFSGTYLESLGV